jgi:tRNA A37 N6-isopentenylltransferase MiaA
MTTPTQLINGQTVYEVLQEKGLLNGLTDEAFASTYSAHLAIKQQAQNESAKDTGGAEIFDLLQKNDPRALAEIKLKDPEGFRRMEEAYLNRPIANPTGL